MIYKIQKIFDKIAHKTNGKITDSQQLENLLKLLFERRILIEHDIPVLLKYIKDYPFDFPQFCNYVRHIFKLDIEQILLNKINIVSESFNKISQFLNFCEDLNNEDLFSILSNYEICLNSLDNTLNYFKKNDFLFKNLHDDIYNFLWDGIYRNLEKLTSDKNPDVFVTDPVAYQSIMTKKIEYEFELIRVKQVTYSIERTKLKKPNKIAIEKAICADRDIPVQVVRVPNNFYNQEIIANIIYKCESYRELLLSKYFAKFTGFDDISSDDFQYYYFEYIEGVQLVQLIKMRNLDINDNSLLFKYIAKEILMCLRDLVCKTTHTFSLPITADNFYYDVDKFRLYILNLEFGSPRKAILDSQNILEAKVLFFYGLILIELLSICKAELRPLNEEIRLICQDLSELDCMKKIFDHVYVIEEQLTSCLENDYIISIIIECLISPYKAKIVLDDFYEKKNFLKEIFEKENNQKIAPRRGKSLEQSLTSDQIILTQPYYENEKTLKNEELVKNIMTTNLLLIHPYYTSYDFNNDFINYLLTN
jgi:hypothetical protein